MASDAPGRLLRRQRGSAKTSSAVDLPVGHPCASRPAQDARCKILDQEEIKARYYLERCDFEFCGKDVESAVRLSLHSSGLNTLEKRMVELAGILPNVYAGT